MTGGVSNSQEDIPQPSTPLGIILQLSHTILVVSTLLTHTTWCRYPGLVIGTFICTLSGGLNRVLLFRLCTRIISSNVEVLFIRIFINIREFSKCIRDLDLMQGRENVQNRVIPLP